MTFVLALAFIVVVVLHSVVNHRPLETLWPFIPAFLITFAVDVASALHQIARALTALAASHIKQNQKG